MKSPSLNQVILRINLGLTLAEGVAVLAYFLGSPSETGSAVFAQYSLPRLMLIAFTLTLLAGFLFLLFETFRPFEEQRRIGKWLTAVTNKTGIFWFLFVCCVVMYFLIFIPEDKLGSLIPYYSRIVPLFLWFGISSGHWLAGWIYLQWAESKIQQLQTTTLFPFALFIVFLFSRAVYDRSGFVFQTDAVNDYWQMIDPLLLQTDLWRSLWYLHSQPPMLNLFVGLTLQFFPSTYQSVFHIAYFAAGLMLAWAVYRLGLALELPPWLSLTASMLFTISPPVVLYEHWLFYTYPVAAALALSGVALYHFHHTQKFGWGLLFFSLLAFIALSWSLFHLIWLLVIFATLFFINPYRRIVFFAALLPILIVMGWYGKNYFLFGEFTASTWAGMNFSHPTTLRLPEQERTRMIQVGELSPLAQYPSFSSPESYLNLLPDTPTTGFSLLDATKKSNERLNFHHLVYVETGNYYQQDALRVLRTHPALYLRSIAQSFYIFFHSASDYDFLDYNRQHIPTFESGWNRLFFVQWQMNEALEERTGNLSLRHTGWLILLAFLIAIFGSVRYLWRQRKDIGDAKNMLIPFMGFNIVYLALAGNLFDLGENNRFRFVVDAFILLLFLFFVITSLHQNHTMNYFGSGSGQASSGIGSRMYVTGGSDSTMTINAST
ncbi:MAG: hypothetical protein L0287_21810 [Anaerolineae bacterium]|nr:hypothetical protein [Anaerolineae bacterium]